MTKEDTHKKAHEAHDAPAETKKAAPYTVAPGKSITTPRGVIDAGEEILASDFVPEGQKRLDELVAKGYVVKGK